MNTVTLLPCPFCGSVDASVFGDRPGESMFGDYSVICGNPNCQAACRYSGNRDKAIAAWNKRAAAGGGAEEVGRVYTMEALVPGGEVKYHASLNRALPAGTKLYASPPATVDAGALREMVAVVMRSQQQCDEDGQMIEVSRQALDELAALIGKEA